MALLLLLVAGSRFAWAVNAVAATQVAPPDLVSLLDDLSGSRPPDRLFAARELKRQVRRAIAVTHRREPGTLVADEAIVLLDDFDHYLAPRCIAALEQDNVRLHCAIVLGLLETPDALPALRAAAQKDSRPRVRRRIQRAIEAIEAGNPAPPAVEG